MKKKVLYFMMIILVTSCNKKTNCYCKLKKKPTVTKMVVTETDQYGVDTDTITLYSYFKR